MSETLNTFGAFNKTRENEMSEIGKLIHAKIKAAGLDNVATALAASENILPLSAKGFLGQIHFSMERFLFHDTAQSRHIEGGQPGRLARVFHILKMAEDDPIITRIKKYMPSFEYPLEHQLPRDSVSPLLSERLRELE